MATPFDADRVRRVLVICTRQIGDVLLTTPLIAAARARWPEAEVDVLGFAGTLGMLQGNRDVHAFVEVPPGSGWRQSLGLIRRYARRYDLAFIAQYSDRAHLYGAFLARHRSGLVLRDRRDSWWKRLLLDHAVTVDEDQTHAVLEKLRLIAPWAPAPSTIRVQPPAGRALPEALARRLAERRVVLHVPTLVRYKLWPIPHQIELVRALVDEGLQVLLSGGPSEADRARTAAISTSSIEAAAASRSALTWSLYFLIPVTVALAAVCGYFAIAAPHPAPGTDIASLLAENPQFYNLSLGHLFDLTGAAMGLFRGPLIAVTVGMIIAGPGSYPLTAVTWLLVYEKQKDPAKGQKLVQFLSWMLVDGERSARELSYAPLPSALIERVRARVATIQF